MTRLGSFRLARRAPRVPLRQQLLALELAKLLPGRPIERTDLLSLFKLIWRRGRDATWTVSELVRHGLVDRQAAQQLGRDLRRQFRRNEPVGPFRLRNHGRERDGSTWQLSRM
jgi:hypothetical protein